MKQTLIAILILISVNSYSQDTIPFITNKESFEYNGLTDIDIISVILYHWAEYEKECYNDSTETSVHLDYSDIHESILIDSLFYRIKLKPGFEECNISGWEPHCTIKEHYVKAWKHNHNPTFDGFIEYLKYYTRTDIKNR